MFAVLAKGGLGWLPEAPPGNACADEAGIDGEINKAPQAGHTFDSSLSGFEGLAPVPKLRVSRASLDSFFSTSAVKSTGRAAVGGGVLALL